jgi:hypothetical protein
MMARTSRGEDSAVTDITVEEGSGFGFGGEFLVSVITVFLTAFGKALIGKLADATWTRIANSFRPLRPKGAIETVYRSKTSSGRLLEVLIRYPSVLALRADQGKHPIYIAMAMGYADARPTGMDGAVSLEHLLSDEGPNHPEKFLLRPVSP